MAAVLPDFEYDVFISYRHNDNRSGWVREFVHRLRLELAATVKEPVSVYFDENPHDGILETDVVDDSVRSKLNCLIFIPILSQTYCDPKSFAWQNEFMVFKNLAVEGAGLKIKLANGNTASRILPISIHVLDADDQRLIENEIGPLRSIDFIFRSQGVNRPLTPTDSRADNLNKVLYSDQVNKVANAVKKMIGSLRGGTSTQAANQTVLATTIPGDRPRKRLFLAFGLVVLVMLAAYLSYYFFRPAPMPLDRSIAVLAFDDLSQNHDQGYFSDGISEEIINALVKIEGLKVPGRTSSFQFKGKNMGIMEIGAKLNVSLILEGSVRKSGNNLRITAQLVNAANGYHLWSETFDHDIRDIFKAQDDVTKEIMKQLHKQLGVEATFAERKLPTTNLEAYDLYLRGHEEFMLKGRHAFKARELLEHAIKLDSNFAMAHAALAEAYSVNDLGLGNTEKALNSAYHALALDSSISSAYAVIAWMQATGDYASNVKNAGSVYANFAKAIKLDPRNSTAHLWAGICQMRFGLYAQAIEHLRAAVDIDPLVPINHGILGWTEYLSGQEAQGRVDLEQGIKMGWTAGNQRLACYFIDNQKWEKAEHYFIEHARLTPMSTALDYHRLVTAIREKDVQEVRHRLNTIKDNRGFAVGFKARIYFAIGDNESVIALLNDWGVTEATRPGRGVLRKHPGFIKFVKENGVVDYWNKYGWPAVCSPVGGDDLVCN